MIPAPPTIAHLKGHGLEGLFFDAHERGLPARRAIYLSQQAGVQAASPSLNTRATTTSDRMDPHTVPVAAHRQAVAVAPAALPPPPDGDGGAGHG